jgi:ribosomal protein S18 acetylase RimI-like enzyme
MIDLTKTNTFKIREAIFSDIAALAVLHVETFNETHGILPNGPTCEVREWQWQKAFQNKDNNWFCFVIEKGQQYRHDDHLKFSGELNKIYLLKKYHRRGLGKQLICKVAHEFLRRGISSMLLFGDAENPSNKFYEAMGAEKLFAKNGEFHGGYGWRDLKRLIANCTTTLFSQ